MSSVKNLVWYFLSVILWTPWYSYRVVERVHVQIPNNKQNKTKSHRIKKNTHKIWTNRMTIYIVNFEICNKYSFSIQIQRIKNASNFCILLKTYVPNTAREYRKFIEGITTLYWHFLWIRNDYFGSGTGSGSDPKLCMHNMEKY